jgi:hypothetical protein
MKYTLTLAAALVMSATIAGATFSDQSPEPEPTPEPAPEPAPETAAPSRADRDDGKDECYEDGGLINQCETRAIPTPITDQSYTKGKGDK